MLNVDLLRETFTYDSTTGRLVRKVLTHHNQKKVTTSIDTRGYFTRWFDGKSWVEHRLVYAFRHGWVPEEVDHINERKTDNRIENLRPCNRSQNKANTKKPSSNSSGFKGVSKCNRCGKWKATICKDYKQYWLGYYETPEEAHSAYMAKAVVLFGEFSNAGTP